MLYLKGDRALAVAAFVPFLILMVQQLVLGLNLIEHDVSRIISISTASFFSFAAILVILKTNPLLVLKSFTLIFLLVLFNLIAYPENASFLYSGIFYLVLINLPTFLCIASIKNLKILKSVMLKISILIFLTGIAYLILLFFNFILFETYSMSISYYLLIPALVFASQKKKIYNLFFVLSCISILLIGSRGAVLIALFYFLYLLIFNQEKSFLSKLLLSILIISLGFLNYKGIILFIEKYFGFTSRTLNLLVEGKLTEDSGRNQIYEIIITEINEQKLFGHGLFADRRILENIYEGNYTHNIFLEILLNFGIIFGFIIIVVLVYKTLRVYLMQNLENKIFFVLFIFAGLVPLFFSGSYLTNNWSGLFLGSLFLFSNFKKNNG